MFFAGGEVSAVLFEGGFGGADVFFVLLGDARGFLVVGVLCLVFVFEGLDGRQGGEGLFGLGLFLSGLFEVARGGGDVFGKGGCGALLLGAQGSAVLLLLAAEGETVAVFALLLFVLLVLAAGVVALGDGASKGFLLCLVFGFEGAQGGFACGEGGFEGGDAALSGESVVGGGGRLDAAAADAAAIEGEVLDAVGEVVRADVVVVFGERLQVAEPRVQVGVAGEVGLPGRRYATAAQLGMAVSEGVLPVCGADAGVQAFAEVAANGGLPDGVHAQVFAEAGSVGLGAVSGRRGLQAAQGVEFGLLAFALGVLLAQAVFAGMVLFLGGLHGLFGGGEGFGGGFQSDGEGFLFDGEGFECVGVFFIFLADGFGAALFETLVLGLGVV